MFGNLLKAAATVFKPVVNVVNKVVQNIAKNVGGGWFSKGVQAFNNSVNKAASGGQASASHSQVTKGANAPAFVSEKKENEKKSGNKNVGNGKNSTENSNQESISGFPQDIRYSPTDEIDPLYPFDLGRFRTGTDKYLPTFQGDILPDIDESTRRGIVSFLHFVTGYDGIENEHDPLLAINNLFQLAGGNAYFDGADWQTTQLEIPAETNKPQNLFQTFNEFIDTVVANSSELVEEGKEESPELNYRTQEYLKENVEDWDESLTTEAELKEFLIQRLETMYPDLNTERLRSENLTIHEISQLYRAGIHHGIENAEETFSLYSLGELQREDVNMPFEVSLADDLVMMTDETPLENEELLLEAFGYYSSIDAQIQLRDQLNAVYETYGIERPDNLEEWDVLQLANEYYDLLTNEVKASFDNGDETAYEFQADFTAITGYTNVPDTIERLQGTYQPPDLSGVIFVASIFLEPVDWVVTAADVASAVLKGDWGSVAVNVGLALLPLVPGTLDNALDLADDVTNASRRIDIDNPDPNMFDNWYHADIDVGTVRTSQLMKRNELMHRGLSEEIVDEMLAGNATLPRNRGQGSLSGQLEVPHKNYTYQQQNDVANYLSEEGYEVISLGGDNISSIFRDNMKEIIDYQGFGNPDLIIVHRNFDGTVEPRVFDVYTPQGTSLRTMEKEIVGKVKDVDGSYDQVDRIVLNLQDVEGVDLNRLEGKIGAHSNKHLKEIIVVEMVDGQYSITDVWTFSPNQ